jgi:hypothetical protein
MPVLLYQGNKGVQEGVCEHANLTTVDKGLGKELIFSVITNMQNFHSRSDYQ